MKRRMIPSVKRRGAAAVEFALVLPILLLFIGGSVEIGRAVMVQHVLEESARAGCRVASMDNGTRQDVLDIVDHAMRLGGCPEYTVTMDPDPPINLLQFEHVMVSVIVDYGDVGWLDFGFMSGMQLTGVCVMPAEAPIDLTDPPP